jgi:hypothetical protein
MVFALSQQHNRAPVAYAQHGSRSEARALSGEKWCRHDDFDGTADEPMLGLRLVVFQ